MIGPGYWGPKAPTSSYLIVPMGGQPAQVGASSPNAPNLPGARPVTVSRVSLRPPQQVLSVYPASPGILPPQPSPSAVGKKTALSPKVQMPKPVPSQVSASSKRSVQKEPILMAYPELSETVRSKFRETLAAALCVDSDQQSLQQSASNISPIGSSGEHKHEEDGTLQRPNTCISHGESKAHLENDGLGESTVVSDVLQGHGPFSAAGIVVGASESFSQLNSKRATTSDSDAGVTVSLNEPEFKRTKTSDGATGEEKDIIQKGQSLALGIEEELFKLFGGVNKKYKEKGRSLLFNLKDKSNPVLREWVLSGEITPKYLCSMTTDELTSKELSAWRLAKAEELAKMVVLPNREVNVRRLIRKTHKGEFHVEVEETDSISVGVELGSDVLSHVPSKSNEGQIKSDDSVSVHRGDSESDNAVQDGFSGIGNSNLLSNLECLANGKTDVIQERVVHDLKYTENLPEIMSWGEFVDAPDSDIPLECNSTETAQDDPSFTDKAYLMLKPEKSLIGEDNADPSVLEFTCDAPSQEDNCQATIKSTENGSIHDLSPAKQPNVCLLIKSSPEKMDAEKLDTGSASIPGSTVQLNAISDAALTNDSLWEGTIQLTLSSLIKVAAIFKSGEKPSTNGWRHFVEIKGRVRLPDFQDFLEQLPKSRSRTITVTELRWKEVCLESGRKQFLQTINSYIADERVGLVKLAEGAELYLCPSQGKAAQILTEYLPKEHSGIQTMTGVSVIGVFVWHRPRIPTETPTRCDGSRRQPMSISRKQQAVLPSSVPMPSQLTRPPASHFGYSNEHPCLEDDATGNVPLGFGYGVIEDENDLPEYDFASVLDGSPNVATPHRYRRQQHGHPFPPPADLVRRLVRKYGSMYASAQPWESYGDLPEWHPSQNGHWYNAMQQRQHVMVSPQLSSPVPHVYDVHEHHAMAMHQPRDHQHMFHPAEAQSWRPGWQWQDPDLHEQHAMAMQQPWNHQHMFHPAEAQSRRPGWQWQDPEQETWFGGEPTWLGGAREPWHGRWSPY
ncbi:hypothetical protein SEVIR_4G237800v4 [Setaria viridis]